jgi:hypothetical protein
MTIEHGQLCNEFISFWFETLVNGELRYETHIDFVRHEWHTYEAGIDGPNLFSGKLDPSLSEAVQKWSRQNPLSLPRSSEAAFDATPLHHPRFAQADRCVGSRNRNHSTYSECGHRQYVAVTIFCSHLEPRLQADAVTHYRGRL